MTAKLDLAEHLTTVSHRLSDDDGVVAHPHRVASRVRILELERLGERLHAGQKQLLEPARLRLDALLEAFTIGAELEHHAPLLERLRDARAHVLELIWLDDVVRGADRDT